MGKRRVRRRMWGALTAAWGTVAIGCGASARTPPNLKPLDEPRARAVIDAAIRAAGLRPEPVPRRVTLNSGRAVAEDATIASTRYGVAYLTGREAQVLGRVAPARAPKNGDEGDELELIRGEGGAVTLILDAARYRYDQGPAHTVNVTTAENALRRDVDDYLVHVVKPDAVE
ncbi:MAG: hypothetical protein AAF928_13365 [Myxococcota bacterium]